MEGVSEPNKSTQHQEYKEQRKVVKKIGQKAKKMELEESGKKREETDRRTQIQVTSTSIRLKQWC